MTVGSQVKSCFSSIKSAEANIQLLAKKTQHEETRQVFEDAVKMVSEIKDDLQKQVMYISQEEPQYKQ